MDISTIISRDIVFLDLKAETREDAVSAMINGLAAGGYVADKEKYHTAVNEREAKGTTGIGFGVAIPHGKSDGVSSPCIAFARL